MLSRRTGIAALLVGSTGALACGVLVVRFLRAYRNNDLGWRQGMTPPEFYSALGHHYGRGFLAGFFLCLFLLLVGAGLQRYHRRKPQQP